MKTLLFTALILALFAFQAEALCLALPLPTTPLMPNYTMPFRSLGDEASGQVWRQPCTDGSSDVAVLIRLSPVDGNMFLCGPTIVQGGVQRDGSYALSTSGTPTFCDTLFVPMTVVLTGDYDRKGAFSIFSGASDVTSVDIPAAGPPPPPPTVLAVTVHALGCTTCQPGNTLGFELHVTNPGEPLLVELKTGARLPGGIVVSILGRHEEEVIGGGVTVIPLFSGLVLPPGTPAGAYAIEAALLEPELGVTLSRHSLPLTLVP